MSTAVMIERVRALVPESQDGALLNQVANRIELLLAAESGMSREMACIRHALDIPPDQSVQSGVVNAFVRLNGETLGLRSLLEAYDRAAKDPVYQYQSGICNDENGETDWYWDDCDKGFYDQYAADRRRILYAAPPLPVDHDRLHEGAYRAGLTVGWNFGIEGNNDGFNQCLKAHEYSAVTPSSVVPDERVAYEEFIAKRLGDRIDTLRAKNGDPKNPDYMAWDMTVGWIAWQGRAAMSQSGNPVWSGIDWAKDCGPTQAVPEGWALVPAKATAAMVSAAGRAAREYMEEYGGNSPQVIYQAMLAAAPQLRKDGDA
ncbi:hypothetical protein [Pectobacterium brasiliense]|nr:hypothetical protein [Pectobacterium brasiliense]